MAVIPVTLLSSPHRISPLNSLSLSILPLLALVLLLLVLIRFPLLLVLLILSHSLSSSHRHRHHHLTLLLHPPPSRLRFVHPLKILSDHAYAVRFSNKLGSAREEAPCARTQTHTNTRACSLYWQWLTTSALANITPSLACCSLAAKFRDSLPFLTFTRPLVCSSVL